MSAALTAAKNYASKGSLCHFLSIILSPSLIQQKISRQFHIEKRWATMETIPFDLTNSQFKVTKR